MIDIKAVLTRHNIHFVEHGPNTGRNHVSIKCPYCGPNDPSEHCGIDLSSGYWHCWRDPQHSGKNLAKLLAMLDIFLIEEKSDTIQKLINRTFFEKAELTKLETEVKMFTELPDDFINIADDTVFSRPYLHYLQRRGFKDPMKVARDYQLCRTLAADKWSTRLIIPIWVDKEITWTARAIGDNPVRYLSPGIGEAKNIKHTIFNYNELKETTGRALVIVEGPFDALKVDVYNKVGIRATCIFGMSLSSEQEKLLEKICPNFDTILIGLDQGTLAQSIGLMKTLRSFSPIIMNLPDKDFGEMKPEDMAVLFASYLHDEPNSD